VRGSSGIDSPLAVETMARRGWSSRRSWAGWPVSLPSWKAQACVVAGRNLTHDEWSRFVRSQLREGLWAIAACGGAPYFVSRSTLAQVE